MKKLLLYKGREIPYELHRKPVKNMNARVRQDGSLAVSVPRLCPQQQIEAFLLANMPRLLRAMDAIVEKRQRAPAQLVDGGTVMVLGDPCRIRLLRDATRRVWAVDGEIYLAIRPQEGEEQYATLLQTYITGQAKQVIGAAFDRLYEQHFSGLFTRPMVHYRQMVSRWGSCCRQRASITLNTRLLQVPMPALEYVVLHELVHMLHPDHSRAFYAALAARMPDHQARAAALRSIDLRLPLWQ